MNALDVVMQQKADAYKESVTNGIATSDYMYIRLLINTTCANIDCRLSSHGVLYPTRASISQDYWGT